MSVSEFNVYSQKDERLSCYLLSFMVSGGLGGTPLTNVSEFNVLEDRDVG
jgi:hypothetical protein